MTKMFSFPSISPKKDEDYEELMDILTKKDDAGAWDSVSVREVLKIARKISKAKKKKEKGSKEE